MGNFFSKLLGNNKNEIPRSLQDNTVTDINGNIYKAIKIGTQDWMVENLKVEHYRNGDPIQCIINEVEWSSLTMGAYCCYDNDSIKYRNYGKLYNWYAIHDFRGLAPEGWHIPNNEEWTQLINYIGGKINAGDKMVKSIYDRTTNESGFTAIFAGSRGGFGSFNNIGNYACFWTSSESDIHNSIYYNISIGYSGVNYSTDRKNAGMSIRCVKD
jgi:uncharacterized protein (TIGR02145 family)